MWCHLGSKLFSYIIRECLAAERISRSPVQRPKYSYVVKSVWIQTSCLEWIWEIFHSLTLHFPFWYMIYDDRYMMSIVNTRPQKSSNEMTHNWLFMGWGGQNLLNDLRASTFSVIFIARNWHKALRFKIFIFVHGVKRFHIYQFVFSLHNIYLMAMTTLSNIKVMSKALVLFILLCI